MGKELFRSWFNQPKVLTTILLFSFIASGCATTLSPSASRILSADDKMVMGCTYVGDVHGFSGWGGLARVSYLAKSPSILVDVSRG